MVRLRVNLIAVFNLAADELGATIAQNLLLALHTLERPLLFLLCIDIQLLVLFIVFLPDEIALNFRLHLIRVVLLRYLLLTATVNHRMLVELRVDPVGSSRIVALLCSIKPWLAPATLVVVLCCEFIDSLSLSLVYIAALLFIRVLVD